MTTALATQRCPACQSVRLVKGRIANGWIIIRAAHAQERFFTGLVSKLFGFPSFQFCCVDCGLVSQFVEAAGALEMKVKLGLDKPVFKLDE